MIRFSRHNARQVRTVLRRGLGIRSHGITRPVVLETGPNGLFVHAVSGGAAIEFHEPGELPAETITVPFQLFIDCEAKSTDLVTIESHRDGKVTAQWTDGGIPQLVEYSLTDAEKSGVFPTVTSPWAENPPELLEAIREAIKTTDPASARFATGCIQLRGKDGSIRATDGRQLLVQPSYAFPWEDDRLIPGNDVFACGELPADQPVRLAYNEKWSAFNVGPWTIWLEFNSTGRFPNLDHHLPNTSDATTVCRISDADADFLLKALPRLPGDQQQNFPVTVDLNGHVAVRGRASNQSQPTEVILSNSSTTGTPIRVNTSRTYLSRALKLGFRNLHIYGQSSPVLCADDRRKFVWALLTPEDVIATDDNAIRIASGDAVPTERTQTTTITKNPRRKEMVRATNIPTEKTEKIQQQETTEAAETQESARGGVLQSAVALRESLQGTLAKTTELIVAIRRDSKRNRVLRSTLASLRQLQGVEL